VRRRVLVLAVGLLAVFAAGGAALAAERIECPNRAGERCVGTQRGDQIRGSDARDVIRARGGADTVGGTYGADLIYGGLGPDYVKVGECKRDRAFGGPGNDRIDVYDNCGFVPEDPPTPFELRDFVDCGPGFDLVMNVRPEDAVAEDCERKVASEF
jgi:hypothetical protein